MSVINTNTKSLVAQNALTVNNRAMSKTMEQLSTGKRINGAKDDAAGLAISSKMTSQIKGLNQAVRNANDAISLIQVAEGSLVEVTNMMQRMRELAVQSANDTNTSDNRDAMNLEFQQLKEEINRVGKNTQWNDMNLMDKSFDGGAGKGKFVFQVGANSAQTIQMQMGDYRTNSAASTGTAAVSTTAAVQSTGGQAATSAAAQISTISLSGGAAAFKVGEKLSITVGDNTYEHTVATAAKSAAEVVTAILGDTTALNKFQTDSGLKVSGSGNSLAITGAAGQSFTPTVTTTGLGQGVLTVGSETVGTATTRESNTVALSGTYVAGDKLTFNNGTQSMVYEVTAEDAAGDLDTLALNITKAADGYFDNTTVDTDSRDEISKISAMTPGTAFAAGDILKTTVAGVDIKTAALPANATSAQLADALVTAINGSTNAAIKDLITASKDADNNVILTGSNGEAFTLTNVSVRNAGDTAAGTGTIAAGGGVASELTAAVDRDPVNEVTTVSEITATAANEFVAGDTLSLNINGTVVTTAALAAGSDKTANATALKTAIEADKTTNALVTATIVADELILTGKSAGTSFTVGNVSVNGKAVLDTGKGVAAETTPAVSPKLTFSAVNLGANELNLTVSYTKAGAAAGSTSLATVQAQQAQTATSGTTAQAQSSSFSFEGSFNAGDKISVVAGDKTIEYTVSADDEASSDQGESIATNVALKMFESGVSQTVARSGNSLTLSDAAGVSFAASASVSSRVATGSADLAMIDGANISTQGNSNSAITSIDAALRVVNRDRGAMGATINRLTSAADNMANISQNTSESRSRIMDTDYAQATTELARTQIISQAATAMLAQANQAPQSVLSLLR